jgi:hypothetical protein
MEVRDLTRCGSSPSGTPNDSASPVVQAPPAITIAPAATFVSLQTTTRGRGRQFQGRSSVNDFSAQSSHSLEQRCAQQSAVNSRIAADVDAGKICGERWPQFARSFTGDPRHITDICRAHRSLAHRSLAHTSLDGVEYVRARIDDQRPGAPILHALAANALVIMDTGVSFSVFQ